MKYIHTENCSSSCFCAIVEIDKRNARKFINSISISQIETSEVDKNIKTGISSLEQFLTNRNRSLGCNQDSLSNK